MWNALNIDYGVAVFVWKELIKWTSFLYYLTIRCEYPIFCCIDDIIEKVMIFLNEEHWRESQKHIMWCGENNKNVEMRLNFYTIRTEIYVSDVVKTAFRNNKLPTWNNFMDFGEERCIPKERTDIRE